MHREVFSAKIMERQIRSMVNKSRFHDIVCAFWDEKPNVMDSVYF